MTLGPVERFAGADRQYAVGLVHTVCCLAGDPEFIRTAGNNSLAAAISRHDSARLFGWLVEALSYQDIADRVTSD